MRLTEMDATRLGEWLPLMWEGYRQDLIDAGESVEAADKNVERHQTLLFEDGRPGAGQHVFDVLDGDERVGVLWLSQQDGGKSAEWFVYDVIVEPEHRGKGYGRATMKAGEDFAREHGGTSLALNVFGPNVVARRLYESMDYQLVAQSMKKSLA